MQPPTQSHPPDRTNPMYWHLVSAAGGGKVHMQCTASEARIYNHSQNRPPRLRILLSIHILC